MSNGIYDFFATDNSMHSRFMHGLQELNEEYVQFISDKGENSCDKCLGYHGQIFKKSDITKPQIPIHPNCKCKYIPSAPPANELYFREEDAPGQYGLFGGGVTFSGNKDFIDQLDKLQIAPHSIDKLIISNHSGLDGLMDMGKFDDLSKLTQEQILKLKEKLHKNSIVDIRMCSTIETPGGIGEQKAQELANKLDCIVLAYGGSVSSAGTRSPYNIHENKTIGSIAENIFRDHKPKYFYPNNR